MSYLTKAEITSFVAGGASVGAVVGVAVQNIQSLGFANVLLGARVGLLGVSFEGLASATAIGGAVALAGCAAIGISAKLSERRAASVLARHVSANNGRPPSP